MAALFVPGWFASTTIRRFFGNAPLTTMLSCQIALSYGCGLRAGEVVRLKTGDIDRDQEIIRVIEAKGRKDSNVMLPDDVLGLLQQWWRERRCRYDVDVPRADRYLFYYIQWSCKQFY